METRVSIEIGNQTIVAAFGYVSDSATVKLNEVAMAPTEGYENGKIIDKPALMQVLYDLVNRVTKQTSLRSAAIQFVMPAEVVQRVEHTVNLKSVKLLDKKSLREAAAQCKKEITLQEGYDIIDMIPSKVVVNGEERSTVNIESAANVELTWSVFVVPESVMTEWMELFDIFKADSINFIPYERACGEAFAVFGGSKELSIVDLGAESERVLNFTGGLLKVSERLRLGADTIDQDITWAYKLPLEDARELKLSHGEALLYTCKMDYVPLPDGLNECKTKELMVVIQSRLEELYEGVIYILQQNGCRGGNVVLIGGGNNLKNSDLLFKMLSGMTVIPTKYMAQAKSESDLMVKEFAVAVGALGSETQEDEPVKSKWFPW
ncbi:MAG: hypothetical protein E7071_04365 [Bacteroidales bacterium]|nr:hypothetical protein [Bacteroidales bacterium]